MRCPGLRGQGACVERVQDCSNLHMRPCSAPSGLDVALIQLLCNRVIVQNVRVMEFPARDSAIAMAQTETARIARLALAA
jgi:hypothetical protein